MILVSYGDAGITSARRPSGSVMQSLGLVSRTTPVGSSVWCSRLYRRNCKNVASVMSELQSSMENKPTKMFCARKEAKIEQFLSSEDSIAFHVSWTGAKSGAKQVRYVCALLGDPTRQRHPRNQNIELSTERLLCRVQSL